MLKFFLVLFIVFFTVNLSHKGKAKEKKVGEHKVFHTKNKKLHKKKFILAEKITYDSVMMLEKHYEGYSSYTQGLQCLNAMRNNQNNHRKLHEIYLLCHNKLLNYKRKIKANEISYYSTFPLKDLFELNLLIKQMIPSKKKLHDLLIHASSPELHCSIKGGSASLAFILGANIGIHQFKCKSTLGRRVIYGLKQFGIGIGIGAFIATSNKSSMSLKKDFPKRKKFILSYKTIRDLNLRFHGAVSLGLIGGLNYTETKRVSHYQYCGLGACIYGGKGLTIFHKVKELTHDFRELYELLEMNFNYEV